MLHVSHAEASALVVVLNELNPVHDRSGAHPHLPPQPQTRRLRRARSIPRTVRAFSSPAPAPRPAPTQAPTRRPAGPDAARARGPIRPRQAKAAPAAAAARLGVARRGVVGPAARLLVSCRGGVVVAFVLGFIFLLHCRRIIPSRAERGRERGRGAARVGVTRGLLSARAWGPLNLFLFYVVTHGDWSWQCAWPCKVRPYIHTYIVSLVHTKDIHTTLLLYYTTAPPSRETSSVYVIRDRLDGVDGMVRRRATQHLCIRMYLLGGPALGSNRSLISHGRWRRDLRRGTSWHLLSREGESLWASVEEVFLPVVISFRGAERDCLYVMLSRARALSFQFHTIKPT